MAASGRANASVPPPLGNGTSSVTGRSGHDADARACGTAQPTAYAVIFSSRLRDQPPRGSVLENETMDIRCQAMWDFSATMRRKAIAMASRTISAIEKALWAPAARGLSGG